MRILKRFSFWFFLFSVIVMFIELFYNPIVDIFFIDGLFEKIALSLNPYLNTYNKASYQLNISGALIHIILYTFYGFIIDLCITWIRRDFSNKR